MYPILKFFDVVSSIDVDCVSSIVPDIAGVSVVFDCTVDSVVFDDVCSLVEVGVVVFSVGPDIAGVTFVIDIVVFRVCVCGTW